MPKSHRGPSRPDAEGRAREPAPEGADQIGESAELSEIWARGNQAATERLDAPLTASEAAQAIVDRAAGALRIAPKDGSLTDRLVELAGRSRLPEDRKEIISSKLRMDQATADEIASAVSARLGADGEALRSSLLSALQRALPSVAPGSADPVVDLAASISRQDLSLPEGAVAGLLRDLVMIVAFGWDEDEEMPPPGDYAAEEGGW